VKGAAPGSSPDDVLLSGLYQRITEQQQARFAPGYDLAAGLDRYRAWMTARVGDPDEPADIPAAGPDATPSGGELTGDTPGPDGDWAEPGEVLAEVIPLPGLPGEAAGPQDTSPAEPLLPDPFGDMATARAEWSADHAVVELYAAHYKSLVRLAAMLVRDVPTAEEVVQDAFVAMHGGWQRLKDTEKALAYLRQAVVNRSRSVLRHRNVVDKNLQKPPPDMPSAEHGAFVLLERGAVVAALRELPDRQREAIVLRYYADLSEAEIAASMGISRGAVKSHTARGIAALRTALEQD
jgi:RNA polymerase sigma-70 factor (sigma-E family)